MALSKAKLETEISTILKSADLSCLSAKKVRKQLEEKHDVDLTDRKNEIDGIIMRFVNEAGSQSAEESEPNSAPAKGGKRNGQAASADSDNQSDDASGSDFEAPEDMGAPKKKMKMSSAGRSNGAAGGARDDDDGESDDDDEEEVQNDEALARQLQAEDTRRRTRGGQNRKAPKVKKKPTKSTKPRKTTGKSTYGQECMLSPKLAAVMGTDRMARSNVVKQMWVIIKERNLQDPKNKMFMLCDEELMPLFKRKRVRTFGMMKFLAEHIFKPEEYESLYGVAVKTD